MKYEQEIYTKLGRTDSLLPLAQRIQTLTDSLNKQEYKTLLANSTMEAQLQQAQLMRKDAEEKALIMTVIAVGVLSILLLIVFVHYIRRIHRKHSLLSTELEHAQTEIQTLKDKEAELTEANLKLGADKPQTVTPEELYCRACIVMDNDQPYLNSKYTIDDLARHTFTNKAYISAAINQLSGMTFRNWLAKYRVEYAKRIMLETPDISITQLSKMCGFDGRNSFYRQFSNIEGMTPTEWIKSNVSSLPESETSQQSSEEERE